MISRMSLLTGGVLSGLAVVLGAFGAHGLKARISSDQLQSFETGVRYQLYHSLALLVIGLLSEKIEGLRTVSYFFIAGIICFSGSIYLLSTRELTGLESMRPVLGPITPIGGLLLIMGWAYFSYSVYRTNSI